MKPPLQRWRCPVAGCGHTVDMLVGPAIVAPTCPHGGTARSAMTPVLMVLVDAVEGTEGE